MDYSPMSNTSKAHNNLFLELYLRSDYTEETPEELAAHIFLKGLACTKCIMVYRANLMHPLWTLFTYGVPT